MGKKAETLEEFKLRIKPYGWITCRDGKYYFKRRDTSKPNNQGAIYYTKCDSLQESIKTIDSWIKNGFPMTKKELKIKRENDIKLLDFLIQFWSTSSEYYKNSTREGNPITKNYLHRNQLRIKKHVADFFDSNVLLSEVTTEMLNDFFRSRRLLNITNGYIRSLKTALLTPLKWGRENNIIKQVIDFNIICPNLCTKKSGTTVEKRGILTDEEQEKLLDFKYWDEIKAYMMFYTAINCGLRLGEIRALKIGDVHEDFIHVTKAYNDIDKLKGTKTGVNRFTPCTREFYFKIRDYVKTLDSNCRSDDDFLFADYYDSSKPIGNCYAGRHFYKALENAGIQRTHRFNTETGQYEYICFHSLRHQTATRWVKSGEDIHTVALAMGHSINMLQEIYSNHHAKGEMELMRESLEKNNMLGVSSENEEQNIIYKRA